MNRIVGVAVSLKSWDQFSIPFSVKVELHFVAVQSQYSGSIRLDLDY